MLFLTLLHAKKPSHKIACHGIYLITFIPQDDLLKILGEKHPLYDFLSILSLKCSYILFSKEHVREILLEVNLHKSAGNSHLILSCMTVLVVLHLFLFYWFIYLFIQLCSTCSQLAKYHSLLRSHFKHMIQLFPTPYYGNEQPKKKSKRS